MIATKGKAEVLAYPTVTWKDALATEAMRAPDGFVVRAGGDEFRGKRLIDELPPFPDYRSAGASACSFARTATATSSDWAAWASWRPVRSLPISP